MVYFVLFSFLANSGANNCSCGNIWPMINLDQDFAATNKYANVGYLFQNDS